MRILLLSILLCYEITASFGDSVESQLQLLQEEVNQLQREMRTQQEMQEKHEAEIDELKRQQASMAGTVVKLKLN